MDPRVLESSPVAVTDPGLQEIVGEARFYSITYRCALAQFCREGWVLRDIFWAIIGGCRMGESM